MNSAPLPRVLTIAGSDSGGGAGIQADLKTFSALGVYGMTALTSVTAQNTVEVRAVHDLPADFVSLQIDLVAQDIGVDAAKTGMLSNSAIINAVAESIERNAIRRLVVDPVMIAKSGDSLLQTEAVDALRRLLLPLAMVVTPNAPEAEALAGRKIQGNNDIHEIAKAIHDLGAKCVLIKGGHLGGDTVIDYLYDGSTLHEFPSPRIHTKNTHGTGCTFSAAIAAYLARGLNVIDAVAAAKEYLAGAITHSLALGSGHGPLHHGWATRKGDVEA